MLFKKEKMIRKWRALLISGLLAVVVCTQSGCGFSFCGFGAGGEELSFVCGETPGGEVSMAEASAASGKPLKASGADKDSATAESAGKETGEDSGGADAAISSDGKVNINLAGLEELMILNGVGESRARAIIEYRETNGPFQSEEDIMLIPGIKEGIYSKIKEQIAVH